MEDESRHWRFVIFIQTHTREFHHGIVSVIQPVPEQGQLVHTDGRTGGDLMIFLRRRPRLP